MHGLLQIVSCDGAKSHRKTKTKTTLQSITIKTCKETKQTSGTRALCYFVIHIIKQDDLWSMWRKKEHYSEL